MTAASVTTRFLLARVSAIFASAFRKTFSRFLGVGAFGFVVDATVFFLLQEMTPLSVFLCKSSSTLVAITATWLLNRRLTFRNSKQRSLFVEYGIYLLASCVGALANLTAVTMIAPFDAAFYHIPAFAAGSVAGIALNFILYDKVVFGGRS